MIEETKNEVEKLVEFLLRLWIARHENCSGYEVKVAQRIYDLAKKYTVPEEKLWEMFIGKVA